MSQATPLNPYVAGGALSDPTGRGFFGREDILAFVRSSLAAEQRTPVLLYGQRRIGKSSILRQIAHRLAPEHACVFFDLQGKASMNLDQVLYGLARALADTLRSTRPEREDATEDRFVDRVLAPAITAVGDPRRLVLLFDEFDVVDERLGGSGVAAGRFIGFLGELMQKERHLGCILVVGRKTDELSEEFNGTLLKNAVQKRIGRLDERQTAALVREPSAGRLCFTDAAVQRVFELTGGHPFCTQILCNTLWTSHVTGPAPFEVTPTHIDQAVPVAIELGTTGLNWIFDGLTSPAHRVFLAALAGQVDPLGAAGASPAAIEEALLARRIAVDRLELSRAPRDLERWDVITPVADGYRFAVAMVGQWVRQERPLEQLERDVRFANPRAFSYYELAVDAHRRGDLDRALSDYRGALEANPVFLEAQQGMAAALRQRRGPGDLDAAVEACERAFDLDPEGSRHALLDLLLESLEETPVAARRLVRYRRLVELAPDSLPTERANRVLRYRGERLLSLGRCSAAFRMFSAVDDAEGASAARRKLRSALTLSGLTAGLAVLFLTPLVVDVMSLGGGFALGPPLLTSTDWILLAVLFAILGTAGTLGASAALRFSLALGEEPETGRSSPTGASFSSLTTIRWLVSVNFGAGAGMLVGAASLQADSAASRAPVFWMQPIAALVSGLVYWALSQQRHLFLLQEEMRVTESSRPGDAPAV